MSLPRGVVGLSVVFYLTFSGHICLQVFVIFLDKDDLDWPMLDLARLGFPNGTSQSEKTILHT